MTPQEMTQKLSGLQAVKSDLVQQKAKIELEIGKLNASVAGHVPNRIFQETRKKRVELIRNKHELESQISTLKHEIHTLSQASYLPKAKAAEHSESKTKDIITELRTLRDEYQAFASDRSRVASMRSMASEFAMKLTAVIRDAISRVNETESGGPQ